MAKPRKSHLDPNQLPLITPNSSWVPPTELPDLRGKNRLIAWDTETKDDGISSGVGAGWAYRRGYITGVSMAWGGEAGEELQSVYASIRHPETANFEPENVARWLDDHFKDPGTRFVAQNGGYDLGWVLADLGVKGPPGERLEDTQAAAVMVDENRLSYKLDDLCTWQGIPGKDEQLLKEAAHAYGTDPKGGLWRMPARYVGPYAEQDAVSTLMLIRSLYQTMKREETLGAYRTEVELIPMVMEMRRRGVRLDVTNAEKARDYLIKRRDEVLSDISYRLKMGQVTMKNIDSPQWMERVFNDQGIEFQRTEKSGQGSFKNDWMKKAEHWLPRLCVDASRYHMAADKFIEGFLLDFSHKGRLHGEVHQFRSDDGGTVSHRFSYANPPLQQMPSRDPEIMSIIRGAFLPEEGEIWGAHDYCHDDQTEVLTERGWVLFKDLGAERVAQWSQEASQIDFVEPLDRYVGEDKLRSMVRVKGTRQIDYCVTEDHRCLVRSIPGTYREILAKDIKSLVNWITPQAGVLDAGTDEDSDLIRFVVAAQADAADRNSWIFYLKKERKIERLVGILDRLGYDYKKTYIPEKGEQWQIVVRDTDPRVRQYLLPGKVFNTAKILGLSHTLRKLFIDELPEWDGKRGENGTGQGISYGSIVEANVDTAQAVASTIGKRATKHLHQAAGRKPFHHVTISMTDGTWGTKHTKVERVEYTGRVYCLTVPSGYLVTRRAGHVLVSGNSQQEYRLMVHYGALMGASKVEEAVAKYRENPKTDFHSLVAELTGLDRKRAKDVNFATAFGAGVAKFALMCGMDMETAKATMNQYNVQMPFIKELAQRCQSLAEKRGFVKLIDGARSHFDMWEVAWRERGGAYEPPKSLANAREHWEGKNLRRAYVHKSMNRLIQGSGARQMKQAMLKCWNEGLLPMIQLHDELSFSHQSEATGRRVEEIMRDIIQLQIPSAVDSEYGTSWGTAAKVEQKDADGNKKVVYSASWDEAVRLRKEGKYWEKMAA